MIGDENVWLRLVVRYFVNIFVVYAYQQKPDVGPVTAYSENQISSPDLPKKQSKEYNWYYNDHERHKYNKGIQTVQDPDWRQEDFHSAK